MHAPTRSRCGKRPARAATTSAPRPRSCLQAFLTLIEKLDAETRGLPLHEQVDHVIQASGLVGHYQKEKADKGEARLENLEELVSAARGFEPEDGDMSPLMAFLSHAVLESGEGQAEEWEDCVQMMTLHSAKGLEFPVVFLCGMEDGLFPHQRSVTDVHGLEEERRLCYVGVTRAMRSCTCTYAEQRRMHGIDSYGAPSRFLAEIAGRAGRGSAAQGQRVATGLHAAVRPIHVHRPAAGRRRVSMSGRASRTTRRAASSWASACGTPSSATAWC